MLVVYAAAALAIALIGARYLKSASTTEGAGAPSAIARSYSPARDIGATGAATKFRALVVHVGGAVRRPGVVRVRDGDRVGDAIAAAGGSAARADLDGINLAMRVADGQQLIVPARTGTTVGAGGSTGPVSLGSSTAEQLDQLEGIGPGLAQKIVAYRSEHGGFRSLDELGEVPGIGEKRLESLRAQLQP
ncbi:MAG TPA: helix-hairpin-helix domain-containing protein [Solirubrobacterales bacterium]|jgi:competence protein ComEA|nr:helix-hairpin-helix domain-containing protein [Solirubrobacterales bacterium]